MLNQPDVPVLPPETSDLPVYHVNPESKVMEKTMDAENGDIKKLVENIKASAENILSLDIKANYMRFQKELTRIRTLVDVLESVTIDDDEDDEEDEDEEDEEDEEREIVDTNAGSRSRIQDDTFKTNANLNNQKIKRDAEVKECPVCMKQTLITLSTSPLIMGCADKNCTNNFGTYD